MLHFQADAGNPLSRGRVTRSLAVAVGCTGILSSCSQTVKMFVANPCNIDLDVVIVNRVVESTDRAPDGIDVGAAQVAAGGVAKIGHFAANTDRDRTLFIDELGYRLVFDDEDLAASESTLVIPADLCPAG